MPTDNMISNFHYQKTLDPLEFFNNFRLLGNDLQESINGT